MMTRLISATAMECQRHLTASHLTASHLTASHLTASHLTASHLTASHLTARPGWCVGLLCFLRSQAAGQTHRSYHSHAQRPRCHSGVRCSHHHSQPMFITNIWRTYSSWYKVRDPSSRKQLERKNDNYQLDVKSIFAEDESKEKTNLLKNSSDAYGEKLETYSVTARSSNLNKPKVGEFSDSTKRLFPENNEVEARPVEAQPVGVTIFDVVQRVMAANRSLSYSEWDEVGEMFATYRSLYHHWPTRLILMLTTQAKLRQDHSFNLDHIGSSLLAYCRQHSRLGVKVPILAAMMELYAQMPKEKVQDMIYGLYEEIKEETTVLDPVTSLQVMEGLSTTDRWRHCYKFIPDIELVENLKAKHWNPLAAANFRNDDTEEGWRLLEVMAEMIENDAQPNQVLPSIDNTVMAILHHADRQLGRKLLHLYRSHHWLPSQNVIQHLRHWFQRDSSFEWEASTTSIQKAFVGSRVRSRCGSCGHVMEEPWQLSEGEFAELGEAFLESALVRNDLFLWSSPAELQRFQTFFDRYGPFKVVIDGLNIMSFFGSQKKKSQGLKRRILQETVSAVRPDVNSRVLIISRKHTAHFLSEDSGKKNTFYFFMENSSKDDPYMLYAALRSGQDTLIVSHDSMDDHSHVLGTRLCKRFRLWQSSHQIVPVHVPNAKVQFKWPNNHQTVVQGTEDSWHIPFEDGTAREHVWAGPDSWMCVRRK